MAGTDAEAVASSMVADTASAGREVRVQPGMTEFCHPERWEVRGADSVSFCGSEPGSKIVTHGTRLRQVRQKKNQQTTM